jgi:hypothetical protein
MFENTERESEHKHSDQSNGISSVTKDIILSEISSYESLKNICIRDIGAFCHYRNSDEFPFDQAMNSEMIKLGNLRRIKAKKVGNLEAASFNVMEENLKLYLKMLSLCLIFGSICLALTRP